VELSFTRSGGFAGMRLSTHLDTRTLSPDEAKRVQRLIEDADLFNISSVSVARSTSADRFQYDLTVDDQHRQHTIRLPESAVPDKLRPLLSYLIERSKRGDPDQDE